MPNQRMKGRKSVSAWVPVELKREIERLAAAWGVPVSQVVEKLLSKELLRDQGDKNETV